MKVVNLINNMFDYMYYRINVVYKNRKGNSGYTALFGISLFQILLIFITLGLIFRERYDKAFFIEKKELICSIFIVLQVLLLIRAYFRYKKIDRLLHEKWKDEKEPNKSINGALVVLGLLTPFFLLFIL